MNEPMSTVNKDGIHTFHSQLRTIILDQIKSGELQPGQKIPSERELSDKYGVSRTTAKTAVLELLNDGLVVRATGKGTFVSDSVDAARLRRPVTGNVAFVLNKAKGSRVPFIQDAVYSHLSRGLAKELSRGEYHLMYIQVDDEDVAELASFRRLLAKVDGVVIGEARSRTLVDAALAAQVPVVLASPTVEHCPVDVVEVDNAQLGFEATRYLIENGHRRIAIVRGPDRVLSARLRFDGYRRALDSAGIEFDEKLSGGGEGWSIEVGENNTAALLARNAWTEGGDLPFTAVFAANDLLALGAIRHLESIGKAVPDDVSVIGCDNLDLFSHTTAQLTSMDSHIDAIARTCSERILARINSDTGPVCRVLFPATVVVRRSCRTVMRQEMQ